MERQRQPGGCATMGDNAGRQTYNRGQMSNVSDSNSPSLESSAGPAGRRPITFMAVVACCCLAVLLAVRPLASPDLGYHLAYGQQFLDSGRIVDHNEFIYTLPAATDDRPTPGPACWYDPDGRYRFPNANWLSQVIMAAAWRAGGATALCVLQAALAAGIFAAMLLTMRRLRVPWPLVAAGLLLTAMTAYMRLSLRPEVFGYLLLAGQLYLLSGERITWPAVAALVGLQLVLVNTHSYFLLAVAITGAVVLGRLLSGLGKQPAGDSDPSRARPDLTPLLVALAGQVAVCFANPWTWRLAALPIQTIIFMQVNEVSSSAPGVGGHPWSYIGEFFRPLSGAFVHTKATYAYYALLALAAAGGVSAAVKRRWGWLLIIAGMTAVSLAMRRNIAPAAVIIVPPAMAACCGALAGLWARLSSRVRMELTRVLAGIILLAAAWFGVSVATQGFYFSERSPVRLGGGLSRLQLPLDAADWLIANPSPGRLWTDYTSSSNIHYFAGRPPVPIVTNTWAYPPQTMREVLATYGGTRALDEAAGKYGFDTVALRADRATAALVGELAEAEHWRLAYLDAMHVIFRKPASSDPQQRPGLTERAFDVDSHIAKLKSLDPVPAHALHVGGMTLYDLGWDASAAATFAAAVAERPDYYQAWNMRGVCLARLGTALLRQTGGKEKLHQAADCFEMALEMKGDYAPARINLSRVHSQIATPLRPIEFLPH